MKAAAYSVVLILLSLYSVAQQLPDGTVLPVELGTAIRSGKITLGETVSAKLAQYVDVDGMHLARGTRVSGRVLALGPGTNGAGQRVALAFDHIKIHGQEVPITTTLRALASTQEVFEAQLPTNAIDDYGTSIRDWNTTQIGGQTVYRGDGTVTHGLQVVGSASIVGEVFGKPTASPRSPCARDRASDTVQSFWVFSTDACGIYGFDNLKLAHAGRSEPVGQIVLESSGKLDIRPGSGLLLVVISSGDPAPRSRADSQAANLSSSIQAGTHP